MAGWGHLYRLLVAQTTASHNLLNKPIKWQAGLELLQPGAASRLIQSSSGPAADPFEVCCSLRANVLSQESWHFY